MKKLLLFAVLVMAALLQTGCVKQKQCEMGIVGTLKYYEDYLTINTITIKAEFIPDNHALGPFYFIYGYIPKEYQVLGDQRVCVLMRDGKILAADPYTTAITMAYKIDCIERCQ